MRRAIVLLLASFNLVACSAPQERSSSSASTPVAADAAAVAPAAQGGATREAAGRASPPAQPGTPPQQPGSPQTATAPLLAYTYYYELVAGTDRIRALMLRHQAACNQAGPLVCQVVSANESKSDEDNFTGALQLRAQPAWLQRFRDGLEADAQNAGGRVAGSRTESEDLTRAIVDTEATLRAKTALRDRLQTLLATRQGDLEELLAVERALAEVQGEIDAYQSNLAVMRTRVATSTLNLTYRSRGVTSDPGALEPVTDALSSFVGLMAGTLGVIIRLVAVLLIPGLIVWGILWLFRKRLPKFGRKPAATAAPPPAQAP